MPSAAEVILAVREANGFAAALEAVRGIDARTHLRHLWPTLTVAAGSREPRALPLLRVALATDEKSAPVFFRQHAFEVPAISAVFHLADEEGMAAAVRRRRVAKGQEAARIDQFVRQLAEGAGLDASALAGGDVGAWRKALAAYWARRDQFFDRQPGDPALSRGELEKRLARWEKEGRVDRPGAGELRAVLAVARAEDLPAIHRARGRVLLRQSDECVEEAQWLERIARVVHRRAVGNPKPNE